MTIKEFIEKAIEGGYKPVKSMSFYNDNIVAFDRADLQILKKLKEFIYQN